MRLTPVFFVLTLALSSTAMAKDDHHECEAALARLDAADQQRFSGDSHHEHQQAKEAHKDGDFKKCADQASKALAHMKKN